MATKPGQMAARASSLIGGVKSKYYPSILATESAQQRALKLFSVGTEANLASANKFIHQVVEVADRPEALICLAKAYKRFGFQIDNNKKIFEDDVGKAASSFAERTKKPASEYRLTKGYLGLKSILDTWNGYIETSGLTGEELSQINWGRITRNTVVEEFLAGLEPFLRSPIIPGNGLTGGLIHQKSIFVGLDMKQCEGLLELRYGYLAKTFSGSGLPIFPLGKFQMDKSFAEHQDAYREVRAEPSLAAGSLEGGAALACAYVVNPLYALFSSAFRKNRSLNQDYLVTVVKYCYFAQKLASNNTIVPIHMINALDKGVVATRTALRTLWYNVKSYRRAFGGNAGNAVLVTEVPDFAVEVPTVFKGLTIRHSS